jgi:protein-S-isoprenylcysteine O-methyltransferase Ste14
VRISTIAEIIAAAYGALLGLWLLTLPAARRAFSKQPAFTAPGTPLHTRDRSAPAAAAGTLAVFLANIFTLAMFLFAAVRPEAQGFVESLRIPLPAEAYFAGAILFLLNGLWGWLVLVFNPAYSPFFMKRKGAVTLATRGPYALVRHPRYASEAALSIILFLFTGAWIPLLGILGWPSIRRQAVREEDFLLHAAPDAYERYRAVTGRFLPRWKFRKSDRPGN